MIETQCIIHGRDTIYRVRPNPDTPALDGSDGIVLEWSDDQGEKWNGYFHIGAAQAMDVAGAIHLIMTGRIMEKK